MDDSNPYRSPLSARGDDDAPAAKMTLVALLSSFEGRIPRRAYWGATFGAWTVFLLYLIALDLCFDDEGTSANPVHNVLITPALILMFWARLAVQAKRWHDRNMSGWWMLIDLVPFGGIYSFIQIGCCRGTFGANDYGSDPT